MNKIPSTNQFWQKNIFFIIALLVALSVTWKIIDQVNYNYELEQQADETRAMINLLNQQKKNQTLNNEFFRSDYYLDLAKREQQGYTLPDESVLIINENKIIQIKNEYQPKINTPEETVQESSNLQNWQNFIFGGKD